MLTFRLEYHMDGRSLSTSTPAGNHRGSPTPVGNHLGFDPTKCDYGA